MILANSDPGGMIVGNFKRKLLELLFDGKPEADNDLAAAAKAMYQRRRDRSDEAASHRSGGMMAPQSLHALEGAIEAAAMEQVGMDLGKKESQIAIITGAVS